MVGGLALRNFIRTATKSHIPFLRAVGKWKSMGLAYNYTEFGNAFATEVGWQVKRSAFEVLPIDRIPIQGNFIERPLKQFTKYHGFGFVNVWDRASGMMEKIPVHVYFDRMRSKAELNQMLIDAEEEMEEEERYKHPTGRLITSAYVEYVDHNKGEAY